MKLLRKWKSSQDKNKMKFTLKIALFLKKTQI